MTRAFIYCPEIGMTEACTHVVNFNDLPIPNDMLIMPFNGATVKVIVVSRGFNVVTMQKGVNGSIYDVDITTLICRTV